MFAALRGSRRRTVSGIVWSLKTDVSNSFRSRKPVSLINHSDIGRQFCSGAETPSLIVDEWVPPVHNPTGFVREVPKKTFGRKQMHAEYIARRMDESSIVIVVRGEKISNSERINLKRSLREAGFRPNYLRAQGLIAAAKYYSKYADPDHIAGAESFGRGQLMLLMYRPPLLTLATTDRLKKLNEIIPLSSDKKTLEKHQNSPYKGYSIVGGYFHDEGKETRNVWLNKTDMNDLLERLGKLANASMSAEDRDAVNAAHRNEDSSIDPHSFYVSQAANIISSHTGAIVQPLERSLNRVPETLQQSVDQVGHVFDSIEEAKKSESN